MCIACADRLVSVPLQPEQRATLHLGEVAAVEVSQPEDLMGSAGDSLVLLKRAYQRGTTIYFYRAVKVGNYVLVVSPKDIPSGQCISCVTTHYFATVVR